MNLSANLHKVLDQASLILNKVTEQEALMDSSPDKWSKIQILGHLIDSAINNIGRVIRAKKTSDFIIEGYEQEFWVEAMNYEKSDWEMIKSLFFNLNYQLIQIIDKIPNETLVKPRKQHNLKPPFYTSMPDDGIPTLHFWIMDYICHMESHLKQIDPTYQTLCFEGVKV